MQQLLTNQDRFQDSIEQLLSRYRVLPVGDGYIDLILPRGQSIMLIRELAQLSVAVESLSLWCLCTPASEAKLGCPHGMGGPINRFGDGWFSECVHYPSFEVELHGVERDNASLEPQSLAIQCSKIICDFIENQLPKEEYFSECLHPGLWLLVPNDWQRRAYYLHGDAWHP
jgi:hypothetical protein